MAESKLTPLGWGLINKLTIINNHFSSILTNAIRHIFIVVILFSCTPIASNGNVQDEIVLIDQTSILTNWEDSENEVVKLEAIYFERGFPEKKIEEFASQKAFQYEQEKKKTVSWWDRFLIWFFDKIGPFLGGEGVYGIVRNIVLVAAVAFAIYKILGANVQGIFIRRSKAEKILVRDEIVSITNDYDSLIEDNIAKGDHQLAVRYMFLKLLKVLAIAGFIHLDENKTNKDYRRELRKRELAGDFLKLSKVYDFIWFGNFIPDELIFNHIRSQFEASYTRINEG